MSDSRVPEVGRFMPSSGILVIDKNAVSDENGTHSGVRMDAWISRCLMTGVSARCNGRVSNLAGGTVSLSIKISDRCIPGGIVNNFMAESLPCT